MPTGRRRRAEYIKDLVFPCKTVRYTHTGGLSFVHFVWKVTITDSETEVLKKNDDNKVKLKTKLLVYHSRSMQRDFIGNFGRLTGKKLGPLREAY